VADRDAVGRALAVDGVVGLDQPAVDELGDPEVAAHLLVGDGGDLDLAAAGHPRFLQAADRHQRRRQAELAVLRPAAPDAPIGQRGREWRIGPLRRVADRHGVDVGVVQQRRAVAGSQAAERVAPPRRRLQLLHVHA